LKRAYRPFSVSPRSLPGEDPFPEEIDHERDLQQAGQEIVGGERCELNRALQRLSVSAKGESSSQHFTQGGREIGAHPDPPNARTSVEFGYTPAVDQKPEKIRKINARAAAECVPSPDARINVQQFAAPISFIVLEFHLHEARIAHRGQ
jgi:hypothetical protein